MGFFASLAKSIIGDKIRDIIVEKLSLVGRVLIIIFGAVTLIGIIGFKCTTKNAQSELPNLLSTNNTIAIAKIIDSVMTFADLLRVGVLFMLLFAVAVIILNITANLDFIGSIGGAVITFVSFILSFQVSVYGSVAKIADLGIHNIIQPDKITAMLPVNIIMWITIAEIVFSIIGFYFNY